jgi:ribosomal protein L11 methyltransferase
MDELDALSVSVEDADADTDAEQALFGEPGMPAPARAGSARRCARCSRPRPRPRPRPRCCWRRTGPRACTCSRCSRVPDQDWVRLTQSAVRAGGDHARVLDRAQLARAAGGAQQVIRLDPGLAFGTGTHPTTRMCLRWIARSAAGRAAGLDACSTTAAARASWPSARRCMARGTSTRSTSTRRPCQSHARTTRACQRRAAARRPARPPHLAPALRAGAGQHPGHAAEAAGAAAVPATWRPGGWLVLAGILERQAEELKRPTRLARARGGRPRGRLDPDDRPPGPLRPGLPGLRGMIPRCLATRCSACGTVFRVVQDQLRVSEGWVRCGRCARCSTRSKHWSTSSRNAAAVAAPWPPRDRCRRPSWCEADRTASCGGAGGRPAMRLALGLAAAGGCNAALACRPPSRTATASPRRSPGRGPWLRSAALPPLAPSASSRTRVRRCTGGPGGRDLAAACLVRPVEGTPASTVGWLRA